MKVQKPLLLLVGVLIIVGIGVVVFKDKLFPVKQSEAPSAIGDGIVENKEMIGKPAPQAVFPLKDQLALSTEYLNFVKDLQESGLYAQMPDDGIYTVLVINNDNYEKLKSANAVRFNSKDAIAKTLARHIIRGRHDKSDFGITAYSGGPKEEIVQLLDINDKQVPIKRDQSSNEFYVNDVKVEIFKDIYTQTAILLEVNGLLPE